VKGPASCIPDSLRGSSADSAPSQQAKARVTPTQTATQNETTKPKNTRQSVESYLGYSAFSRLGLVDQLLYEGFTNSQVKYGVASANTDRNEQAEKSVKAYLDSGSFPRQELIDQLEYGRFSRAQAEHGVAQNIY
jgi:hypothetical protein